MSHPAVLDRNLAQSSPATSLDDTASMASDYPTIPAGMARVLEIARHSGNTLTPREMSEHLARLLESFNALTTRFADNAKVIDTAMAHLAGSDTVLGSRLQSVESTTQRQGNALAVLAASTSADIARVQGTLDTGLADVHERFAVHTAQMDMGITKLQAVLDEQAHIVAEQSARLDQFELARELLDTAMRGNRQRIDTVRAALEAQHDVVSAQVQGLAALHREQATEFAQLSQWARELQSDTNAISSRVQTLDARITEGARATLHGFRQIQGALGLLLLALITVVAAVKWLPALTPSKVSNGLSTLERDVTNLEAQVAGLPSLEYRATSNESRLNQMDRNLAQMRAQIAQMQQGALGFSGHVSGTDGTQALHDAQWVHAQPSRRFTIQIAGTSSEAEALNAARQLASSLAGYPLALASSRPTVQEGEFAGEQLRYNLFLGSFASLQDARDALASLPDAARANGPWVRSWAGVQSALR
jgi:hypothetical protein